MADHAVLTGGNMGRSILAMIFTRGAALTALTFMLMLAPVADGATAAPQDPATSTTQSRHPLKLKKARAIPQEPIKTKVIPTDPIKGRAIPTEPIKTRTIPQEPCIPTEPCKTRTIPVDPIKSRMIPQEPVKTRAIPQEPFKPEMKPAARISR